MKSNSRLVKLVVPRFFICCVAICANAAASDADMPLRDATPAEIGLIRSAMQETLKDADSAKFSNVHFRGDTVCGLVNAKNSYGAYAGYFEFTGLLLPDSKKIVALQIDSSDDRLASYVCAKTYKMPTN